MDDWRTYVDLEALEDWMTQQGLGEGSILNPTALGGGTQNILVRFTRGNRSYVLRRPPAYPRSNSNDTMRREMRMLGAIAESAVPHPRLIAGCPTEDVLGVAFYLMEPVDGFNPTTGLPEPHASDSSMQRRMGLALVEGIAGLGAVDHLSVGLDGFGNPDNYLERQVSRWRKQLESYSELPGWPGPGQIPGVERVAQWLDAHRPQSFVPGIIHGDYHFGNVIYHHDAPELAAIVDWELTTIGDPLIDLGWLLATWPEDGHWTIEKLSLSPWNGFPTSDELIRHYQAHSERDLSHIEWYAVLACYKLGIILEGTHARACAGRAPKEIGDTLHANTIRLFERALGWIK